MKSVFCEGEEDSEGKIGALSFLHLAAGKYIAFQRWVMLSDDGVLQRSERVSSRKEREGGGRGFQSVTRLSFLFQKKVALASPGATGPFCRVTGSGWSAPLQTGSLNPGLDGR
jgi:hypothetical protein